MNILSLSEIAPDDPTNGTDVRFWGLCGQGRLPCIHLTRRASREAGPGVTISSLPWESLRHAAFEELVDTASAHRTGGGFLLARGLDFAERLAKAGVAPDVVDMVDSYSLYFFRRFAYLPLSAPLKKVNALVQVGRHMLAERRASRKAWIVLAAAASDAARLAGGRAHACALPNGTNWADMPPLYVHRDIATRIGFHGTMTWDPNVSSAEYIAREIMPLVQRRVPRARLSIFGGPVTPRIEALRGLFGVDFVGPVDDIRSALSQIDVYLMPMLQGSGVKTKLMEAMSAGLPVVTNSLGVEAFSESAGEAVRLGENADELAASAADLLEDGAGRRSLSRKARAFAEQRFSPKGVERKLAEIMQAYTRLA